jgi:GTP cyclohydrolase II
MSLPTLLKKDVIIPHMKEKKDEIQNITGIDFVMNWFGNRINNPNKIKAMKPFDISSIPLNCGENTNNINYLKTKAKRHRILYNYLMETLE